MYASLLVEQLPQDQADPPGRGAGHYSMKGIPSSFDHCTCGNLAALAPADVEILGDPVVVFWILRL